jgi:hypothetical protein
VLIYVCAPFTAGNGATSEWERRKRAMGAAAVGLAIVEAGHTPIVPHLMFGLYYGEIDESTATDLCLSALEACDALIACDGWDTSDGCVREIDFAGFEGKRVWYSVSAMLGEIDQVQP